MADAIIGKMFTVLLLVIISSFTSCAKGSDGKSFVPEEYSDWSRVNQEELNYPIPGHESHYRIVYINEKGKEVQTREENGNTAYRFPEGTIIVKEAYPTLQKEEGDKPIQLTIMIKDPDHEKARGGWLWVVNNLQEKSETVVPHEFCITCHANANEKHPYGDNNPDDEFRDYVFFAPDVLTLNNN